MKKQSKDPKDLRQILISRSTSLNGKRRRLVMTEIIEKNGILARAQKSYNYFVSKKIGKFLGNKSLKEWSSSKAEILNEKPRHISIQRVMDKDGGTGQTAYRTTGSFYVIKGNRVFAVAFLHSVKFDVLTSHHA